MKPLRHLSVNGFISIKSGCMPRHDNNLGDALQLCVVSLMRQLGAIAKPCQSTAVMSWRTAIWIYALLFHPGL